MVEARELDWRGCRRLSIDGEEATLRDWGGTDHTYGSQHYVDTARKAGTLATLKALILVDMIADRSPRFMRESNSTPWLTDILWSTARKMGHGAIFVDVIRAPIAEDGSIGEWRIVSRMPYSYATHAAFGHDSYLWVMGGVEDNNRFVDNIWRATVGADGAGFLALNVALKPRGVDRLNQKFLVGDDSQVI